MAALHTWQKIVLSAQKDGLGGRMFERSEFGRPTKKTRGGYRGCARTHPLKYVSRVKEEPWNNILFHAINLKVIGIQV